MTLPNEELRKIAGPFWLMLKNIVAGISVKFDADARTVTISKGNNKKSVTFEQIEQAINE